MGMRRDLRMRSPKLFERTYSEGKSVAGRDLVLYYDNREDSRDVKVGLSVGKKVGNAVARNKIKRRLRGILAERLVLLKPGFFAVFIARPRAAKSSYSELRESVFDLLEIAARKAGKE